MFEQTFVQGAAEVRKPWTLAASFTGQLMIVGIVFLIPLMQTARIAFSPPVILYTTPRPVPPPVKVEVRTNAQAVASIVRAVFRPPVFTAPIHIPTKIVTMGGEDVPEIALTGSTQFVGTDVGLPFAATIESAKPAAAAEPVKPKPTSIHASSTLSQAMLIHQVKPPYPPLARAARVSGTVRLAAVIARDGTIQHLQLVSGPPLLVKAALEAVQQWRYKPTLLGGEPVEVITEILVNFNLSN